MLESRNFQDKEKQTITVAFADDRERVAALNVWTVARTKWAKAEQPAIAARKLFERIHAPWERSPTRHPELRSAAGADA